MNNNKKAILIYSGELLVFALLFIVLGILQICEVISIGSRNPKLLHIVTLVGAAWMIFDFVWTLVSKKRRETSCIFDKILIIPIPLFIVPFDIIGLCNAQESSFYRFGVSCYLFYAAITYIIQGIYHYKHPLKALLEEDKVYKLYLCDFDGTLVDTLPSMYHLFIECYKKVGIEVTNEEVNHFMRVPLKEGFLSKGGDLEKYFEFVDWVNYYLNDEESTSLTKVYDDTVPFLLAMQKNNLPVGIVTSNNIPHICKVFDFHHIDNRLFSVMVGNQETDKQKPDPDPILKALEMFNYEGDKMDVVYIGDALNDVKCAQNAGIDAILLDRNNEYRRFKGKKIKSLSELYKNE